MKIFINQGHKLLPDCAFGPYVCCENCVSGFSAFVFNLSKTGNILFRSMQNGNCLFSSASLLLVGDTWLVHELRKMTAVEQHVKATYYTRHLALKSVYEKSQSVIGGKQFSSYIGRSVKIETVSKLFDWYIIWKPLIKGFQNGLVISIWRSGSGDIWNLIFQNKKGFFRLRDLTYISGKAPKRRFLMGMFLQFSGKKHS